MKKVLLIALIGLSNSNLIKAQGEQEDGASEAISKQWELEDKYQRGTFKLVPYKMSYITPFQWTDRPNKQPENFNENRGVPEFKDYQNIETRFQISVKSKIIQDAILGKGDLWLGFTQTANWQMYNGQLSRPFREMNYEPELMFTYPINFSIGDFKMRMLGLSINHQSNGKEAVLSRSWNRAILMSAFEYKKFILYARLWSRFREKHDEDDNPGIEKYIGRGDFQFGYLGNKKLMAGLFIRNNLNFKHNKGFAELALAYPIYGDLKVMFRASHGYGSTLIDYNIKQTILSLGFVFMEL